MDTTSSMKFEPSQLIQQHTRLLWETIRRAGEGITELRSTVQQLEAKNSRLDEHLATLQSEFSQLREENATLAEHASHTDELRSAFTQANATIAELNANLHDRDNEINRIAKELQQLDDLRSLNHTLQTKLNSVTGELELNANDKELLNFATEENASLLKKIDELNEKNIALLADVERLHHDQSESEKTIATLQQAIGALESVLGEERTAKVQLMRDAEELRTLRISSVALQDYADRQANAAKEYEEQLNEMTEKLFLAEKQNTLQSATIVDLEQALSSQQYEELFRERENQYNAQITALQQKVNELERQHESMSGVTNDLAHLKQQLEFATESYNTTKQLVHERDSSLLELQKQYKQSLQQIEQLTSKVHHIENLEMIVAEKDTVIQNLRRDLELSETSFFQQQASLSQFTDEIVSLRRQLDEREGASEQTDASNNDSDANGSETVAALASDLASARNKILELEDNLRFELERNIALKRELNDTIEHYANPPRIISVANGNGEVISGLERITTITESLTAKKDDNGKIDIQELTHLTESIRTVMSGLDTDAKHHILAMPHNQREQLQSTVNRIIETLRSSLVAK